jgi:hypothetical protein
VNGLFPIHLFPNNIASLSAEALAFSPFYLTNKSQIRIEFGDLFGVIGMRQRFIYVVIISWVILCLLLWTLDVNVFVRYEGKLLRMGTKDRDKSCFHLCTND